MGQALHRGRARRGGRLSAREPDADAALLERCVERRRRALEALGDDAALILPAAPELHLGRDLELRYHVDPELYYLTGCTEPGAVAVLAPASDTPFVLFVRPRDPDAEVWAGPRHGPDAARERFRADAAFPIAELSQRLPDLVGDVELLHFRLGSGRREIEDAVVALLADQRVRRQRKGRGARTLRDPGAILDELRLVKDELEIACIRRAAEITVDGFLDARPRIRPGAGEWEVEAALEAAFRAAGAQGAAFPSIVASGPNATVLHYVDNDRTMREHELVLIDAGARFEHYAADISRTLPVDGVATSPRKELHALVLDAHAAALAAAVYGSTETAVHEAALRVLIAGLVDIRLLEGDVEEIVADKDRYKGFLPHRICHWLGLEVHDVGDYAIGGDPRPLRAGMVLTVEPGVYVPEGVDVPVGLESLRGTGIRVEDDLLVTDGEPEVLTGRLPVGFEFEG